MQCKTFRRYHDALIPCYRNIRENASDKNSGRNTGDSVCQLRKVRASPIIAELELRPVVPAQRQQRDSD